jgi:hypothetical protein
MGEREFTIYLDPGRHLNRYRHYHIWERGRIVGFRVQYEALIEGKWYAIVRYDSAHGRPHKDTMHPDGSETKEWFTFYSNAEVLTIGQRDIIENWPSYRARYEREMKQ